MSRNINELYFVRSSMNVSILLKSYFLSIAYTYIRDAQKNINFALPVRRYASIE